MCVFFRMILTYTWNAVVKLKLFLHHSLGWVGFLYVRDAAEAKKKETQKMPNTTISILYYSKIAAS